MSAGWNAVEDASTAVAFTGRQQPMMKPEAAHVDGKRIGWRVHA
jgi:hypothetical protein